MKKALRFVFSRPFFTGLFIILQLCALLLVVLVLNEYFLLFYTVSLLLGVVLVLYIVSRNGNPAYKIAWIIPILALPIFGTLLFLVFGRDTLTKRERQRMDYVSEKYAVAMADAAEARSPALPADAACISRYIQGTAHAQVYPDTAEAYCKDVVPAGLGNIKPYKAKKSELKYKGEPVRTPVAYLPVFPGTNCDYDSAKAWRNAGAEVRMSVFCNLTEDDIFRSIAEMKKNIDECHILMISGGFSAGDEPDGSGKFIANVLNNKEIADAVHALLDRGGLILGICNGFQALVKSGLLPYGRLGMVTKESPTLFRNDINRHISQIVTTRVATTNSPWLSNFAAGDLHTIAVSHGEGKFVVNEELARELFANGQVAFQYVDPLEEEPTMESPYNPNGSYYAIEGIISKNGQILGKMGHTERYEGNLFKNIIDEGLEQPLFDNAVAYFRAE